MTEPLSPPSPPSREPDRARFVEVNRTRLRIWEWGPVDGFPVLCAHGAYDHGRMLDGVAFALAEAGSRVLVPDLRGHGDSGPIANGHTFEASVLDIGALIDAETSDRVGLVGHSMGAGICFAAAATWPERVAWLVSLDGLGPPASGFGDFSLETGARESVENLVKTLGRTRRVFADLDAMISQRAAVNTRMPVPWLHHLAVHGSVEVDGGCAWKWDPMFNTFVPDGFDPSWVTSDFDEVACPVLVVLGGADDTWSFPVHERDARAAHLRHLTLHVVDDAGHYLHLEQPDVVLDLIHAFLGTVRS